MTCPVLLLAVGNPSRGDDALGPRLAELAEAANLPGVEVIVDFQLQVEHALDLVGRERVIFVDAGAGTEPPFVFRRVQPAAEFLHTSHALSPEAVLATYGWPGNVRELENVMKRIAALCAAESVITAADVLPFLAADAHEQAASANGHARCDAERDAILAAWPHAHGNKSRLAELLGVSRKTLYARLKRLHVSL